MKNKKKKKKNLAPRRETNKISSLSYGSCYQILRRANSPLRGRLLDHSAQRDTRGSDPRPPLPPSSNLQRISPNSKFVWRTSELDGIEWKLVFFFFLFSFEKWQEWDRNRMKLIEISDVRRKIRWVGGGGSEEPPRFTRTKRRFLISAFLLFSPAFLIFYED